MAHFFGLHFTFLHNYMDLIYLLSKSGWILINSYTSRASIGKVSSAIRFILLIGGVHCVGVGAFSRKVTCWMRPLCRCRFFLRKATHWSCPLCKLAELFAYTYSLDASTVQVKEFFQARLLTGCVHCVGVRAFSSKVTHWSCPLCKCKSIFEKSYSLELSTVQV